VTVRTGDDEAGVPRRIAVASRSFSEHEVLRRELQAVHEAVTFNDAGERLSGARLVEFLRGHDAAIIALETVDDALLRALPELRSIAKFGVGLDGVDLEALREHGVRLGFTAGVNRRSVAELALGFMLAATRDTIESTRRVREGRWERGGGRVLSGRNVGVVGIGNVGQDLIQLLAPFGCRVLGCDIADRSEFCERYAVRCMPLAELLAQSDFVSLHVPLTPRSRRMIDEAALSQLAAGSVLINTARGEIVDEAALVRALDRGAPRAYYADVLAQEPPTDSSLVARGDVFVTPHIGGSSAEAVLAMGRAAIRGLAEARVPDACMLEAATPEVPAPEARSPESRSREADA